MRSGAVALMISAMLGIGAWTGSGAGGGVAATMINEQSDQISAGNLAAVIKPQFTAHITI